MFKGFDKAKDIQYVYTPVFSSLCGVKLDYNNKAGYLLSGISFQATFLTLGKATTAENWKQTKCSFLHQFFWQEQTAVKRFIFLKGCVFEVGILPVKVTYWITGCMNARGQY